MFGISFGELLIILIVAVIALGPEKLPKTIYEIVKYFKIIKKTVNDAKNTFDNEIKIAELKDDAKKYKEAFTKNTESIKKKLTFEELDKIKNSIKETKNSTEKSLNDIKSSVETKIIKNEKFEDIKKDIENMKNNEIVENKITSDNSNENKLDKKKDN